MILSINLLYHYYLLKNDFNPCEWVSSKFKKNLWHDSSCLHENTWQLYRITIPASPLQTCCCRMTSPKCAYKRTSLHSFTGFFSLSHPNWMTIFGARNHHVKGPILDRNCFSRKLRERVLLKNAPIADHQPQTTATWCDNSWPPTPDHSNIMSQ